MELNENKDLLFRRKKVGFILISSKKEKYKIISVSITPYLADKNKKDENSIETAWHMLKYFSYEIIVNSDIQLFFDFDSCKEELGIDVDGNLPIPYLIKIVIKKKEESEAKKYTLSVIAEKILNSQNKIFDIKLKKIDCPNNDDFTIFQTENFYWEYYIVPKYEEDWKKFCLYKDLMMRK